MIKQRSRIDASELTLNDKLMYINRVAKVMKGGKRLRFSALVVTGDGAGHVGIGIGKANEVPVAIAQGVTRAKKNLIKIRLAGHTIPHRVQARYGASKVVLVPASEGTGVIAGVHLRPLLELAGIRDVLTKAYGSTNPKNLMQAGIRALTSLRTREAVARLRGVQVL